MLSELLQMFYQSVVASILLFTVAYWEGSINTRDPAKLNKLVKIASSVMRAS